MLQCNVTSLHLHFQKYAFQDFLKVWIQKLKYIQTSVPLQLFRLRLLWLLRFSENFLPAPLMWLNKIPAQNLFSLHIWQDLALLLHNSFHDREQIHLFTCLLVPPKGVHSTISNIGRDSRYWNMWTPGGRNSLNGRRSMRTKNKDKELKHRHFIGLRGMSSFLCKL